MSSSLNLLLNDCITDLILSNVYTEVMDAYSVCRIKLTSEIINKINSAILIKNTNPSIRNVSFELDQNIFMEILNEDKDSLCYEETKEENISLDNFSYATWDLLEAESSVRNAQLEVGFCEHQGAKSIPIILESFGLRATFYLDSDKSFSTAKTLREILMGMDVHLEKWD